MAHESVKSALCCCLLLLAAHQAVARAVERRQQAAPAHTPAVRAAAARQQHANTNGHQDSQHAAAAVALAQHQPRRMMGEGEGGQQPLANTRIPPLHAPQFAKIGESRPLPWVGCSCAARLYVRRCNIFC